MNHTSTSFVIADSHPIVLRGLADLLNGEPDFKIVAICNESGEAFKAIIQYSPDITIVDLRLPKMAAFELIAKVFNARPKTRVVIFADSSEDRALLAAASFGVHGIIMKESRVDHLIRCLRRVCAGGRCLPLELVRKQQDRQRQAALINAALTFREREIMQLVAEGLSNKKLAEWLNISEGTVKLHLHHIYRKTRVSCRSGLMRLVLKLGDPSDENAQGRPKELLSINVSEELPMRAEDAFSKTQVDATI
jgi:two-component system nitrate/nitrite response regulator NarL